MPQFGHCHVNLLTNMGKNTALRVFHVSKTGPPRGLFRGYSKIERTKKEGEVCKHFSSVYLSCYDSSVMGKMGGGSKNFNILST